MNASKLLNAKIINKNESKDKIIRNPSRERKVINQNVTRNYRNSNSVLKNSNSIIYTNNIIKKEDKVREKSREKSRESRSKIDQTKIIGKSDIFKKSTNNLISKQLVNN